MARYVLLAFDDDTKADEFVQACQETGVVAAVSNEDASLKHFAPTVRAVYQKPTMFCTCVGGGKQGKGFTRGKKHGWWVHSGCGKPTKAWADGEHWFVALGVNKLPKSPEASEYRGDHVFTKPTVYNEQTG